MIEFNRATKIYNSVIGVNDISVALQPGVYGLLGPNGSGKSTLLNLITGQVRPTLGSVRTLGMQPWNNIELRRRIGVCPEHDLAYASVVALDWLTYLLKLNGYGRREARRRAERALSRVMLGDAMRRMMGTYSRGMRQRVKLAQAFAHDPEFLILDEPFSGLDPIGRRLIKELIREWITEGKGLILASHILQEVEAITQSFLLICGGRLLASGAADEIHALLADVPNEIRIRCSNPNGLARAMLRAEAVESVRLDEPAGGLVVGTCSPSVIYRKLPDWALEAESQIHELHCSDDSLPALFHSLLQIHRGKA